ncbi:(Fe-S)-binding protein [Compostibacter hankyongensis]|uniref:(Fe-S)-binding protein n=2 Tax=Compostibacter hankyongensis TaxID=1007089 RepID=A0ABP8FRV7_9BACT
MRSGSERQRWRNVLLLALGQKKMFRKWIPAVLHLLVYAGFLIINIEILEIVLDGILGTHRLFMVPMGGSYVLLIGFFEILAVLVILGCVFFLARRNILRIRRFHSPEMTRWPRSDANIILLAEIVLMLLFLTMNAADQAAQRTTNPGLRTGTFPVSGLLATLFGGWSASALRALERTCWWLHIAGVLAFLNYLPYSKHLHIILAFPAAYYKRLTPSGEMTNMPAVQREVKLMLDPSAAADSASDALPAKFGARDVADLSRKNLMDAYSCTECGRCTAACPASQTGKRLSPRKIMMDTRDRLETLGKTSRDASPPQDQEKLLLDGYISAEELNACTSCSACVKECPIGLDPLDIILQLRRYLVMEESRAPAAWNDMFGNIENNRAPWKFSPDEREQWIN